MIVAFDSDIWSWQEGGGISRYFVELGKRLEALGHCVDVRARVHINAWLREWKQSNKIYLGDHLRHSRHSLSLKRLLRSLNWTVEGVMARRPDIMHHTAWHSNRSRRTSTVITVHDCVWGAYPDAKYAYQAKRIRKVALEADVVICPTKKTRRDAIKYIGLPPDKIFVAHHGITQLGTPRSPEIPVGRQIAFVGLRSPAYKNFAMLLAAVAHLKDVRLCCLGGGRCSERERALLAELRLEERVQFKQVRGDRDLFEGYNTCSALVIPALEEGFGLPMLEAFALGIPVIASEAEALLEVSAGAATHVDATSAEALAARIQEVLDDRELHARLARSGLRRAADFSWARSAAAHEVAYHAAIEIFRNNGN